MAEDTTTTTQAPVRNPAALAPTPITEFPLALDEFCTRLSSDDSRVELIGAFNHAERVAGRNNDLATNYASRFVAFANQPV